MAIEHARGIAGDHGAWGGDRADPAAAEDPEREPDGVPHVVVGLTAVYAVTVAIVLLAILKNQEISIAVAIVAMAIPIAVTRLGRKSERERDTVHPSR